MSTDPDDSAPWVTGDYSDPAARLIWLDRQRRVADGWHGASWTPPARNRQDAAGELERRAWLELTGAYGAVIDIVLEHGTAP